MNGEGRHACTLAQTERRQIQIHCFTDAGTKTVKPARRYTHTDTQTHRHTDTHKHTNANTHIHAWP